VVLDVGELTSITILTKIKIMNTRFYITLASVLAVGCQDSPELAAESSIQAASASELAVARITRPARTEADVTARLSGVVRVFGGPATAPTLRLAHTPVAQVGRSTQARFDADIGDDDTLKGRYESRDDSFEVFDTTLSPITPATRELDDEAASAQFTAIYGRLVSAGVVDPARVRAVDVIARQAHASEGDQNGLRRTWIAEHAFFVPLTLNGVRIGTAQGEYGLHINVHRSGRLRRIALSGAAIAAGEPGALTTPRTVRRAERTTPAEVIARGTVGNAEIRPLGLRYLLDEGATGSQDLIARDLLWVSPTGVGPEGEVVHGKAYVVSYAVNDAGDAVELSPPPGALGPTPADRVFAK
jgi:hypothetical protein